MKWVLITGATSGIGRSLATTFYKAGYSLILVSRSKEKLKKTEAELRDSSHIEGQKIYLIEKDLTQPESSLEVFNEVVSLNIHLELLINNVGCGYSGAFEKATEEEIIDLIHLNILQLTLLSKYFIKYMKEVGGGSIMNVASTGAYHPGAFVAVYYATKAYVLSLSLALREEVQKDNIYISALCPGATHTAFQQKSGRKDTGLAMEPEKVARLTYKAWLKKKKVIVPGIRNKLFILIPKPIAIKLIKFYQKKTLL